MQKEGNGRPDTPVTPQPSQPAPSFEDDENVIPAAPAAATTEDGPKTPDLTPALPAGDLPHQPPDSQAKAADEDKKEGTGKTDFDIYADGLYWKFLGVISGYSSMFHSTLATCLVQQATTLGLRATSNLVVERHQRLVLKLRLCSQTKTNVMWLQLMKT